jgi:hypothetical protein
MLIGLVGPHASATRLYNWILGGMNPLTFPDNLEEDSQIPIVYVLNAYGHALRFEDSPYPIVIKDEKWAYGSGGDLALGAMEMGATAPQAILVASKYNIYCGCGVDLMQFDE